MLDFPLALLTKKQFLLSELQTHGLRLLDSSAGAASRRGGAGPTDHKAVTVLGTTIMVPVHTQGAAKSIYVATTPDRRGVSILQSDEGVVCEISFPPQPRFYGLTTAEGIPFWKIALLHSRNTLGARQIRFFQKYGK